MPSLYILLFSLISGFFLTCLNASEIKHSPGSFLSISTLNQGLVFNQPSDQFLEEDFGSYFVSMIASDPDGDPITYEASVSDSNILSLAGFSGRQLFLNSIPDASGSVTIMVTATSLGGSAQQSFQVTILGVNDAPEITNTRDSLGRVSLDVPENQTAVTILSASDAEEDSPLNFNIAGGSDAGRFSLDSSSGVLEFLTAPDFETPSDADQNNIFELLVQVNDSQAVSPTVLVVVNLTNVDEGPFLESVDSLSLSEDFGTTGMPLVASDPENDPISFSALSFDPNLVWVGNTDLNQLTLSSVENAFGSVVIEVVASSSGGQATRSFEIQIEAVNDPPTMVGTGVSPSSLSTAALENQALGLILQAIDVEDDSPLVFSISGGADASSFHISQGQLLFSTNPDFEIPGDADQDNQYELELRVSDPHLASNTYSIEILVQDVFENLPPSANAGVDVFEPFAETYQLAGASATDPNQNISTLSWTQISGTPVQIQGADQINPLLILPAIDSSTLEFVLRLTVTDALGISDSDDVRFVFENPEDPLIGEAVEALDRVVGLPVGKITSSARISQRQVNFHFEDVTYAVESFKGEEGWHISFINPNPAAFDLSVNYPVLSALFQGAAFEDIALVISEAGESLDRSIFTSGATALYETYLSEEKLELATGITFLSAINPGDGKLKQVLELLLKGRLAPGPLKLSGRLDKEVLAGVIEGAIEDSVSGEEEEEEEEESFLASLDATEEDSQKLLDFALELPPLTPFPFSSTNDKSRLHVEYEPTTLRIEVSDQEEIAASATRQSHVWFLNHQESVDCVITLNFEGPEFTEATIEGESTVNWADSAGVNVPDFEIRKLLFSGILAPIADEEEEEASEEGDEEESADTSSAGGSSLNKVELGIGLGLEMAIFQQPPFQAIFGLHLSEGEIDEISMTFQSADEDSAGLDLKQVPGIKEVPIISELTLGPLTLGYNPQSMDYYFTSQATWTTKGITGQFGIMTSDNEPTVLLRVDDFYLKDIASDLPPAFENLGFATAAIAVSKVDQSDVEVEDLPSGIGELLGGIVDEGGGEVPVTDGVTVMTALHLENLPVPIQDAFSIFGFNKENLAEMGVENDKLVIAGSVGGIFGGPPSTALSVILPKIKLPPAFGENSPIGRVVQFNDVQGSFFIRSFSANQSLEIGLSGDMNMDVPRVDDASKVDNIDFEGSVFFQSSPSSGAGIAVRGKVGGTWNEPFGLQDISFKDTVLQIGADATGAVKFGLAGDFTFQTRSGQTRTYVFGNGTDVLVSTGVPVVKTFAIDLQGPQLTLTTQFEIQDALLRAFATSPVMKSAIESALSVGKSRDAFNYLSKNLKNKTLESLMSAGDLALNVIRLKDFHMYFATPGGEIPGRSDLNLGMGFVFDGDLELVTPSRTYTLASSKSRLTMGDGLNISGKLTSLTMGPIKLNSPQLAIGLGLPLIHSSSFPYFRLRGGASVLGFGKSLDVFVEKDKLKTRFTEWWGTFGTTYFELESTGGKLMIPDDFLVSASFGGFSASQQALGGVDRRVAFSQQSSSRASSRLQNGIVGHTKWREGKTKKARDKAKKKRKKAKSRKKKQMRKEKELKKKRDRKKKDLKRTKKKNKNALNKKKKKKKKEEKKRKKKKSFVKKKQKFVKQKQDFVNKNKKSLQKVVLAPRQSKYIVRKSHVWWHAVEEFFTEDIPEAAEETGEAIEEVVDEAAKEIEKAVNKAINEIKKAVKEVKKAIKEIKKLDKAIKKLAKEIDKLAKKHLKVELGLEKAYDKAKKAVKKAFRELKKLKNLEKLAKEALSVAENAYSAIKGAVKSIGNGSTFKVNKIAVRKFPLKGSKKIKVDIDVSLLGKPIRESISLSKNKPEDIYPILKSKITKIVGDFEKKASKSYSKVVPRYALGAVVPANDDFSDSIGLDGTQGIVSAVNLLATTQAGEPNHDDLETLKTVWWSYEAAEDGRIEFTTHGSDFDTVLAAYTGDSLEQLQFVASNSESTDASGVLTQTSTIAFALKAGVKYNIVVGGMEEDEGQIQLNYQLVPPVQIPNDHFANARELAADSGNVISRIAEATIEEFEPDHQFAGAQRSVWFEWTPAQSMLASIDTSGTGFDTRLSVYRGSSLTSLVEIVANDDAFEDGSSRVLVPVEAGETLKIVVMSMDHGEEIVLNYSPNSKQPETYARFETPWEIGGRSGSHVGSNLNSYNQPGETGEGTKSIWWKWSSDFDGSLEVDTDGSEIDTILDIYVGEELTSLQQIASNDNDESVEAALLSRLIFPVRYAQDYYFRVASVDGEESSTITLNYQVSDLSIRIDNDDFASAAVLESSQGVLSVNPAFATTEADEPEVLLQEGTLWWSYISLEDGTLELRTEGSQSGGAAIDVFVGDALDQLISVAQTRQLTEGSYLTLLDAKAGEFYKIRLRNRENEGDLSFSWKLKPIQRPVNDLFADAILIQSSSGLIQADNILASSEPGEPQHNLEQAISSVWYRFQAPADGWYQFRGSSGFNARLAAYQGTSLENVVSLASMEFVLAEFEDVVLSSEELLSDGLLEDAQSTGNILVKLNQSDSIYLAVDGIAGAQGAFTLTWNHLQEPSPANDHFSDAASLQGPGATLSGNNQFATLELLEPSHGDFPVERTLWYSWDVSEGQDGLMELNLGNSLFSSVVSVYRGTSIDTLETIAVGDSRVSTQLLNSNIQNQVIFKAVVGERYYMAIGGFDREYGDFTIQIKPSELSVVANDDFLQPLELSGETFGHSGSTIGASRELFEFEHGSVTGGASVWYLWTAPRDGYLNLSVSGIEDQITVAVYHLFEGSRLIEIAADADGNLISTAQSGKEYHIVVESHDGGQEDFQLSGEMLELSPPSNDDYADAVELSAVLGSLILPMDLASLQDGEPVHPPQGLVTGSAWLKVRPVQSGVLSLELGSNYNAGLALYEGGELEQLDLLSNLSPLNTENSDGLDAEQVLEIFVEQDKVYSIALTTARSLAVIRFGQEAEIEYSFVPTLPVADAGNDLEVSEGETVYLVGVQSFDPDGEIRSFQWSQLSGSPLVSLKEADQVIASFKAPEVDEDTDLAFELQVHDDRGVSAADSVQVRVLNEHKPPQASAGPHLMAPYGEIISLDGSRSYDPQGTALSYAWSQLRGETISLSGANSSVAQFTLTTAYLGGALLELVVTNELGESSSDRVFVNPISEFRVPRASVLARDFVEPGTEVLLDGSTSSDFDSELLDYQWRQISGPSVDLQNAFQSQAAFLAPDQYQGSLEFELMVVDELGLIDLQRFLIHVSDGPFPPTADAGPDQYLEPGTQFQLNALLSFDTGTGIQSMSWKLLSQTGNTGFRLDSNRALQSLTLPTNEGQWVFELEVTNEDGLRDRDQVLISTSENILDEVQDTVQVGVGTQEVLDVGLSAVIEGDSVVSWEQTSGTLLELSDSSAYIPSVDTSAFPDGGSVPFTIFVRRLEGERYSKDIILNIVPSGEQVPVANAGADFSIGTGRVGSLAAGSVSTGVNYRWIQYSGPTVLLSDPLSQKTLFITPRNLTSEEILEFHLEASSHSGLKSVDSVRVSVIPTLNRVFNNEILEIEPLEPGKSRIGISYDVGDQSSLISARHINPFSDEQISQIGAIPVSSSDLIEFSIKTSGTTTANITFHLANAVPQDYVWWKFSRSRNQWLMFPEAQVQFSPDRKTVQVSIEDNSAFDDDYRSGEIADPSGPGAPNASIDDGSSISVGGGGGGGCFIATAAFGDYDHPMVILLRELRDQFLLNNQWGSDFVSAYYQYSPPIAQWISKSNAAQYFTSMILMPLVLLSYALLNPFYALLGLILLIGTFHLFRRRRNA